MSSSIKTFWTETLPDPLPANPLTVVGPMAGAGRARCRPAQSQCHGLGDRGRSRLPVGAGRALQGDRRAAGLHSLLHQLSIAQGPGTRGQPPGRSGISLGPSPPPGARRGARSNCCPTPRTTRIFAPGPGRAASAPGPASKANRWSRARRSSAAVAARRAALAFPMRARALPNPTGRRGCAAPAPLGRLSSVCRRRGAVGGGRVPHPRPRTLDAILGDRAAPARPGHGRSLACSLEPRRRRWAAYRYRPISLSSAARPGESFSYGMLLSGASAVRFRLWNSVVSVSSMWMSPVTYSLA